MLKGALITHMYLIGHGRKGRMGKNGPTIAYKVMGAPLRRRNYTHTHTDINLEYVESHNAAQGYQLTSYTFIPWVCCPRVHKIDEDDRSIEQSLLLLRSTTQLARSECFEPTLTPPYSR